MSDTVTTGAAAGSTASGPQERASEVAGVAKDQATGVASTAKEQAASVASTAGEQVRAVAGDAKHQARQLVDNGRQQLRDQAGEQTKRAASSLRDLGDQLQKMVSGQGPAEGPAADLARQAAQSVQQFADSLENRRPEDLLHEVKRFARQRPGVFVLGALGAGFVAGRVLRTIDTSSITEAAKSGAGIGQGDQGQELVSGPGTLGALRSGMGGDLGAGDAMAAGMAGTTPADLVDPPTPAIPTVPSTLAPETPTTGTEV